jgi:protein TonB
MLDQLVESRNNSQQNRRSLTFFLVIGCIILTVFGSAWLRSLFAKELGIGGEDLELSSLVAPVPVPEAEPPKPEPIKQEEKQQTTTKTDVATLKEAPVQDINQAPTQVVETKTTKSDAVSVNKVPGKFQIGKENIIPTQSSSRGGDDTGGGGGGSGLNTAPKEVKPPVDKDEPPPVVKTPTPTPPPKPTQEKTPPPVPKIVSGGVVNGKATSLVKPAYPPAAKAVGAKGTVSVSVVIDENGNVISASASGGHPLLQPAAVAAAKASKFQPTKLSGVPVKVSGIITYNFQ